MVASPAEKLKMNEEDPQQKPEKSSLDRDEVMPIEHLKITLWVLLAVVLFSIGLVVYLLPS
jgi:hypothetical protein